MFEELRRAWQEAVENFWRELYAGEGADPASAEAAARRREVAGARRALHTIDGELTRARERLAAEREAERVCRRREALARGIGDEETARIAAEFASRHGERAAVLERKTEALEAERALWARELEAMEAALRAGPAEGVEGAPSLDESVDEEFHRLDRMARERAAEARLRELKRRMR